MLHAERSKELLVRELAARDCAGGGDAVTAYVSATLRGMTAQVPDTIEVGGVRYAVAGVDGTGLFDPDEYRLRPHFVSTGNWRGFVCGYAVADATLHLRELRLGRGSTVDDVEIHGGTTFLGATAVEEGGELVFRYAALPAEFTGSLMAGDGFVQATYVHMGYAPAWRYERVLELVVDAGRVAEVRDRSAEMAALRDAVRADPAQDPDGDRSDVGAWVARTFRLGYDRTVQRPKPPPGR